jgi:RNA polymerase sigma factor (TIGR02999 family)
VLAKPERPEEPQALQLTTLLRQMQQGDHDAGEKAVGLVYKELHRIASRQLRHERPGGTLETTALINEAYLRLSSGGSFAVESRGHFFAIAGQQMRRILVDHARARDAQRRGGGAVKLSLDQAHALSAPPDLDVLMLDDALRDFEKLEPRAAKVVELRYFGGYTDKQIVETLGVSLATVRRDWEFARCWLFDRMQGIGASSTTSA